MAFYSLSAASGGYLNFDRNYKGLQISSNGYLSVSRFLNLVFFDCPTWCREVGIQRAFDCGTGTQLKLEWGQALSSSAERTLVFNIYYSTKRVDVFREAPKALTNKNSVVLNGFTTGDTVFVGIRATDYAPSFEVSNLIKIGEDLYLPPEGDRGVEESNTNINFTTPYFNEPNEPAGGRITPESGLINPSDEQDNNIGFPAYDFGGWHCQQFDEFYDGSCIGSYAGGEQIKIGPDGKPISVRGLNIEDRTNQRLELLLQQTGQPVVLLRRKWTGKRCVCVQSRRESPITRCGDCFGTGFAGGYDQFISPRRADTKILIRMGPEDDYLKIDQSGGLMQTAEHKGWTLSTPMIRDRDVAVFFNPENDEETWRYEILQVTRNRIISNAFGSQALMMKRQDKTDQIYSIPVIL